MSQDPNFNAWVNAFINQHGHPPDKEDAWQAGREFGRGDTVYAVQPPQDECGRGRYGDGYANGWGDHLRLTDSLRAALDRLEKANEALCALRTQKQYLSMIDSGQQDALIELDAARGAAREALSASGAQPVALSTLTESVQSIFLWIDEFEEQLEVGDHRRARAAKIKAKEAVAALAASAPVLQAGQGEPETLGDVGALITEAWLALTNKPPEIMQARMRLTDAIDLINAPKTRRPHYDIALSKRALAVQFGAKEITWREASAITRPQATAQKGAEP